MRQRSKSVFIPRKEPFHEKLLSDNDENSEEEVDSGDTVSFVSNISIKTEKINEYSN